MGKELLLDISAFLTLLNRPWLGPGRWWLVMVDLLAVSAIMLESIVVLHHSRRRRAKGLVNRVAFALVACSAFGFFIGSIMRDVLVVEPVTTLLLGSLAVGLALVLGGAMEKRE